jgi:hypothetical protein
MDNYSKMGKDLKLSLSGLNELGETEEFSPLNNL